MAANSDIAKIKIAIKQLGISDDDGNAATGVLSTYRQMLHTLTGKTSVNTAEMSDAERAKVLSHLRRRGFKPKGSSRGATKAPGMASRGQIGLIHVLWQALGKHGALEATGSHALATWVQNSTRRFNPGAGYSAPEFLPAAAADQAIEQLKKWCNRLSITWRA